MNTELEEIEKLFTEYKGEKPTSIISLPLSGSYRKYYRIKCQENSYIGVHNSDFKENQAFISFTKSFLKAGLNVPKILAEKLDRNVYLLQDLGDKTLLSYISDNEHENSLSQSSIEMYKKVLEYLPLLQVKGDKFIDYSVCYPRKAFDRQSMMWDLNYFKYYFLKLARIPFDEEKLENDFESFCDYLLQADCNYFLFRDFQSRNIMIVNGEPYFIDYQGGRKGALQYDIASILFEAKTALSSEVRELLFEHYLKELAKQTSFDDKKFRDHFYGYVYVRLMQAMGAYGFRGLYEKKELFLQSIPKALDHLKWLRYNVKFPVSFPELEKVWDRLVESDHLRELASRIVNLTVNINSFSYRRGIPVDETLNGGGFVFDCRGILNPGRLEQYKPLNGLDEPVKQYLINSTKISSFLEHVFALVDSSVESYKEKGYNNLMVNFGCTGGQHRSVFSAERLAEHLKSKYRGININVKHRELEFYSKKQNNQ
jgi:aminoglycoside/choline kinase family phosphotransferase